MWIPKSYRSNLYDKTIVKIMSVIGYHVYFINHGITGKNLIMES